MQNFIEEKVNNFVDCVNLMIKDEEVKQTFKMDFEKLKKDPLKIFCLLTTIGATSIDTTIDQFFIQFKIERTDENLANMKKYCDMFFEIKGEVSKSFEN